MEINILSIYVIPMHMLLVTFKSSFSKKKKKGICVVALNWKLVCSYLLKGKVM